MKFLAVFLILCLVAVTPILGNPEEKSAGVQDDLPVSRRFSIGVSPLPWNIDRVALRWWKNERRGFELSFGESYGSASGEDNEYDLDLGEIRFDLLRRKKVGHHDDWFSVKGIGIGIQLKGSRRDLDDREISRLNVGAGIYFPFGFEHFIFHRFPAFSYSLQLDLYGRVEYQQHDTGIFEGEQWNFEFGLNLKFFLRLYLK